MAYYESIFLFAVLWPRPFIYLDMLNIECLLLFSTGRHSEKNQNKFSKFDTSKSMSCQGQKKPKFTNLASCVPWWNDFEIRRVLSLGSRIDSRNLSTIVFDKIQRGLWIFNKFESFWFAKGRHVVVFTILITRKSVKMDGVNVIDTIRQFLRNFLWFLLLCIELTTCFHEFYEKEYWFFHQYFSVEKETNFLFDKKDIFFSLLSVWENQIK